MNRKYSVTPDVYCGDKDSGQTSAWHIFSALGCNPVCPAMDEYVLGSPLFKKATIYLENGKTFVIDSPNKSEKNIFVHQTSLNKKTDNYNYIKHSDVLKDCVVKIDMREQPNKSKGTHNSSFPYSFTTDKNKF